MKLISWNVNGLRACIQKGFLDQFNTFNADFFCLQETKLSEGQLELELPGYEQYWCYADKKGYSGTAIFTRHTPLSVHYGLDVPELDNEGRLITLEYPEFYLVTCYTPNAQRGLARLDHRMSWDDAFRNYLKKLDEKKPVILCGDLNVAHQDIDLKNPKANRGNAGFSDEERESFQKTLDLGFTDTFRHLHPDATGRYSWWSYMFHARENNAGWRIDYFLVSDRLASAVHGADIHSDVLGSDHCPVSLDIGLICNGGIWSPMSEGAAKQTCPAEKEPKASAVNAKAVLALAAVLVLLIGAAALWKPLSALFPPRDFDNGPTQLTTYTVTILSSPPSAFRAGSNTIVTDENTMAISYIRPSYIDPDQYWLFTEPGNAWLRIDISWDRIEAIDSSAEISLMTYQSGQTATDEDYTLSDSSINSTKIPITTVPYYSDSDCEHLAGWYVWGEIAYDGVYRLSISWVNTAWTLFVSLSPTEMTDPAFEAINITALYTPPTPVSTSLFDLPEGVTCVTLDGSGPIYFVNHYVLMRQCSFWLYIEPNSALLGEYDITEMELSNFLSPINSVTQDRLMLNTPCYLDPDCKEFSGWLVYGFGLGDQTLTLNITLDTSTYISVPDVTERVSPLRAAQMSNAELVAVIATDPDLNRMLYENFGLASTPEAEDAIFLENYLRARSCFPVLAELETRSDALQAMTDRINRDDGTDTVSVLLLRDHWDLFPFDTAAVISARTAAGMTTQELVAHIAENSAISWDILSAPDHYFYPASSTFSFRLNYAIARNKYPVLRELETREDAQAELFNYAGSVNPPPEVITNLCIYWPMLAASAEYPPTMAPGDDALDIPLK